MRSGEERQQELNRATLFPEKMNRGTMELKDAYAGLNDHDQVMTGLYDRTPRNVRWNALLDKPNGTMPVPIGLGVYPDVN
jgi:hypothetical protein